MTKDEALRLVLEALKEDRAWLETDAPTEVWEKNNEAITAIKAALEAKDEPVCKDCNGTGSADSGGTHPWGEPIFIRCHCTYPTTPQLEAKDEPVFNKPHLDIEGPLHVVCRCPTCKVQPQRKPLTDEEIVEIGTQCQWYDGDCERFDSIGFARAIEAAHGIKG